MIERDPGQAIADNTFPALPSWLSTTAREALAHKDRWPHALLISGPEGVGKRALALHFARALLCEAPREDGTACGRCASCRYVQVGQHPDLRRVELTEVDDEGAVVATDVIKIQAIRDLIGWTRVTSHRRGAKVAVIAPAERMNEAASNALLKILEEPPGGTYLLLVAHQPARLPATIASRCHRQIVPLPPLDEARAWLAGQGIADAERVLAQAGGAPLIALSFDDVALGDERSAWLDALGTPETLAPLALAARIEAGGRDQRRDRLATAIDWLIAWTVDLARVGAGGVATRNPERAQMITELSERVARISLSSYYRQLLRQRALIVHPLQPRLVAEALLIEYRALFD